MFRKRKFEADGGAMPDLEDMIEVSPEAEMDAKLLLQRIAAQTEPATMEIMFLLYLEGLTQEEVVEKLGISRTTVTRKITAFKARMGKFK